MENINMENSEEKMIECRFTKREIDILSLGLLKMINNVCIGIKYTEIYGIIDHDDKYTEEDYIRN